MIQQLARYRRQWETTMNASGAATTSFAGPAASNRLTEVTGFGSNPGNLRMLAYVPETVSPSPALVVILHGCTQTAAGYDHGSGWSDLADRYGFVLLYPEQQEANNPKRCFNWFQPGDTERDRGEAHSIRQMVEHVTNQHNVDRSRVFVTGLGRRSDDRDHARDLPGGVCQRRHHRGTSLSLRHQCSGSLRVHVSGPDPIGAGMG